jgi:hypothetical protein
MRGDEKGHAPARTSVRLLHHLVVLIIIIIIIIRPRVRAACVHPEAAAANRWVTITQRTFYVLCKSLLLRIRSPLRDRIFRFRGVYRQKTLKIFYENKNLLQNSLIYGSTLRYPFISLLLSSTVYKSTDLVKRMITVVPTERLRYRRRCRP